MHFTQENNTVLKLILILFSFSLFACLLQYWRTTQTGGQIFVFFYWNLFLAWVPLVLSSIMYLSTGLKKGKWIVFLCVAPLWLLFYPNAPYILTDLLHLKIRAGIPFWYDLILILSFAMNGLLAGFLSLWMVEKILKDHLGRLIAWSFVTITSFLSAFGIYLGRFERWNSWDVFFEYPKLLSELVQTVLQPMAHPKIYSFTLLMGTFLLFTYLIFSFAFRLSGQKS